MYKSNKINIFHRNIDYFLGSANEGSLNSAAKKLGITQSALTISIQKLEEELGIKLFHRTKTGIRLTEKGSASYRALSLLKEHASRQMHSAISGIQTIPLRVGSVEHFGIKYLVPVSQSTERPGKLQLFFMRSLQIYEAVINRQIDLGFVTWTSTPSNVESIPLNREKLAVVGLKSRYAHIEKAKSIEDLRSEKWIYTPKPQYDWTSYIDENLEGIVCGGFFSHVHAILAGLGIAEAQLDAFTSQEINRLAFAPFAAPRAALNYAIFRSDQSPEILQRINKLVALTKKSF